MQRTHEETSELAIVGRVFEPAQARSVAAAKSILALDFSPSDLERLRLLLEKAKAGELTSGEQVEIDNDERAGHVISLMKSKTRISLEARARSY